MIKSIRLFYFILLSIFYLTSCKNNNKVVNFISNDTSKIVDKTQKRKSNTSIDIVLEILTTSPKYLQKTKGLYEAIVKNGGESFGIIIEGSPNPQSDNALSLSDTYNFSLHETYSDRITVIAKYTFNPIDSQLYEYDFAKDKLTPIDFDRNLLIKFNEICD